jgi:hypothetical protein
MWDLTTKDVKVDHRGGPHRSGGAQRGAGRLDYNAIAAAEYRRALRKVLTARSETRLRMS